MFPKFHITQGCQHHVDYQTLFSLVVELDRDKNGTELYNKMFIFLITIGCKGVISLHPGSSDLKDGWLTKFDHMTPPLAKYRSKT